jgi:hypothetical protein
MEKIHRPFWPAHMCLSLHGGVRWVGLPLSDLVVQRVPQGVLMRLRKKGQAPHPVRDFRFTEEELTR